MGPVSDLEAAADEDSDADEEEGDEEEEELPMAISAARSRRARSSKSRMTGGLEYCDVREIRLEKMAVVDIYRHTKIEK